ncbi:c-type cytochrome, methanol metabolism-related [Roseibium suaedae]|uniref:C-type cytochrome, methanol metabolism-related n=1 Tax=Roseibium suaedae TaxID=735517 RepID=A0A1M7PPM3_9HYPH|nr:c-type cytochrome, methanol metabolism-related [Roseibium suaedae]SHN19289.1 c-type cytochrome, methanol metabolism-related [Roseibium suaedae]
MRNSVLLLAMGMMLATGQPGLADDAELIANTKADHEENGRWYTSDDIPTYKIAEDGTVDWPTFSGFRRYNAECFQCHGPDGAGGSYAPALATSVMAIDYYKFYETVVNGKQEVNASQNLVMPALGENKNVMCYLDDIYTYLRARGTGDLGRGRPAKKEKKTDAFVENENACMGE